MAYSPRDPRLPTLARQPSYFDNLQTPYRRPARPDGKYVISQPGLVGEEPRSPLELAGVVSDEAAMTAPQGTQGVQLAQPVAPATDMTGPGRIGTGQSNVRSFYDQQMDALRPGMEAVIGGYGGALEAARAGQAASLEQQMELERQRIAQLEQPQKSDQLGRFAAALLAPTSTGSFFEGFGKATNAALDQRSIERRAEEARQEKLHYARTGLAKFTGEQASAGLNELRDTADQYRTLNEFGGYIADDDLRNGLTPTTPEEIVADARRYPNKYMGTRGQALVADAEASLSKAAERQFDLDKIAYQEGLKASRPKEFTNLDKKTFLDAQRQNSVFTSALKNLRRAQELGPSTYSGFFPNERAWIKTNTGIGINEPEEASAHIEYQKIMQGEAVKQMAETLKGATTDYEMRAYIDMIADPTLPWKDKEPAVTRIVEFMETQSALNSDIMRSIDSEGQLFGGDPTRRGGSGGNARPRLNAQQGADLKRAVDYARQNNAYSGVAQRLQENGYDITAEQLRSLTPEQIDQLIEEGN